MGVFSYNGFNAAGDSVAGTVEALNEKGAVDMLAGDGITPLSLEARESKPETTAIGVAAWRRTRIPSSIKTLFARELATFIHADVPLLEALDVLRHQEQHAAFKAILDRVHDDVQGGRSFSRALASHPRVFSNLLVSMVEVGETGGMLGAVLDQMAGWMEQEEEVRGEIRGAMAYPIMIVILGFVTVFILLSFVLPRITDIFTGMEADLPLPTKILMGASTFMAQWWWAMLIGVAALAAGSGRIARTAAGRRLLDRAALGLPIIGVLSMKSSISRFARASAALLGSGVPLLDALHVVKGLLTNSLMAAMVEHTIQQVTKGRSLAQALGESPYFPASAVHLLAVGERTGRLDEMFERVANTFEKQTRTQIKIMLDLLSPLMIIALAVMVAMIAISILLPIFKMNQMMR